MSDEPLATKSQPPSAIADADYDLIYATVSETAQGRRFLAEYARRCRATETETSLAAIERMQAVMREGGTSDRLQLLLEIADMAQAIVRLRAEILAMKPPGGGTLEATEELDSIVQTTETATSRILASTEQVQEIAWTMRESGPIDALCDEIDRQVTEIYTACSFQDLTGQRTRKVIQVLRYLEDRLNVLVGSQSVEPATQEASSLVQAGVDAVMEPGFSSSPDEQPQAQQDATLEDISREMLAIEPMIVSPPAPAEQQEPKAELPPPDVRPELSVAEAVLAEGQNTSLTDWVVEDRDAPRPEAERAWMILGRMEAQLDPPIEPQPARPPSDTQSPPPPEPALFVAEAMSQLAQELRPVSLLPPPELTFRARMPEAAPLADLATTMASSAIRLRQPDDDTERLEAGETPASAPLSPAGKNETPATAADPDDFLFAPDAQTLQSAETAGPVVEEWKAGTYPHPALVTPQTLPPPPAEPAPQKASSSHDPLAPIRAMSDEQKIALFS